MNKLNKVEIIFTLIVRYGLFQSTFRDVEQYRPNRHLEIPIFYASTLLDEELAAHNRQEDNNQDQVFDTDCTVNKQSKKKSLNKQNLQPK